MHGELSSDSNTVSDLILIEIPKGGLFSKDNVTLDDLRAIDRNRQPPEEGLMCDLMWSDPQYSEGRSQSKRGVGIQFGPDVTAAFCKLNQIDYVVRSHEVLNSGLRGPNLVTDGCNF